MRLQQWAGVAGTSRWIEILATAGELDLVTAAALVEQGRKAIACHPWLLLVDLTGSSFCDARGLSALVRVANYADAAGCLYALIAPQPPVAKIVRIGGLKGRMPVFATIDGALAHFTPNVAPLCRRVS
jgi:anti-anti-sigma factor